MYITYVKGILPNLGQGEISLLDCNDPIIPLEKFVFSPRLWQERVTIAAPHFLHYCNQDRKCWERVVPMLRRKYRYTNARTRNEAIVVALHLRRGDVFPENMKTRKNFTSNASFIRTVELIKECLRSKGQEFYVRLFSQGPHKNFSDFERLGNELWLDESSLSTHGNSLMQTYW